MPISFRPKCEYLKTALVGIGFSIMVLLQLVQPEKFFFGQLELLLRDTGQKLWSTTQDEKSIALIDIDEISISEVGPWPWTRRQISSVVEQALGQGARLVVLDIVLPTTRDSTGDRNILSLAKQKKLVLAQAFDYADRSELIASGYPSGSIELPSNAVTSIAEYATGIVGNDAYFASVPCVGNIGFIPDTDGRLRSIPHLTVWNDSVYPSLALSALSCLNPSKVIEIIPKKKRPLRFTYQSDSWPTISAGRLLEKKVPKKVTNEINGRIVIIGSSALGLADRVATPLESSISGMYVHASAIAELQRHDKDFNPDNVLGTVALVSFFVAAFLMLGNLRQKFRKTLLATVIGIWIFAAFWGASTSASIYLTSPIWAILFLGITVVPVQWTRERRETNTVKSLLSRYVNPTVLSEIIASQNYDALKPKYARIVVMVVDLEDFSRISAALGLADTARLVREFLAAITTPVWENKGTLDSYTGDGLIAFWGAPITSEFDCELALRSAREVQQSIAKLNESFRSSRLPEIQVRIGLDVGRALVGDFGTKTRASYTAIGQCVNVASRLQAKAKEIKKPVLFTAEVAACTQEDATDYLGKHDIRGIGILDLYTFKSSLSK